MSTEYKLTLDVHSAALFGHLVGFVVEWHVELYFLKFYYFINVFHRTPDTMDRNYKSKSKDRIDKKNNFVIMYTILTL